MYDQSVNRSLSVALCVVGVSAFGAAASAQDVLHVYGSEGPFPAISQAAAAFGDENNIKVDVVSGPISKWLDQAGTDGDVIFASAEFMMADLIRGGDLGIDETSITCPGV